MNKFERDYFVPTSQMVQEIARENTHPEIKANTIVNCCRQAIHLMISDMGNYNLWNLLDWYNIYMMHTCIRKVKRLKRVWEIEEYMRIKKSKKG